MSDTLKPGWDHIGICVVFFCHDGEGKFLLHRRSEQCRDEHGCWDFGAGKVEFGESFMDALRREVKEEYCCEAVSFEQLKPYEIFREQEGHQDHWISLPFFVRVNPSEVQIGEPDKITDLGWFSLWDIPAHPRHSSVNKVLDLYNIEFWRYGRATNPRRK